jgi:hypothetical protein
MDDASLTMELPAPIGHEKAVTHGSSARSAHVRRACGLGDVMLAASVPCV